MCPEETVSLSSYTPSGRFSSPSSEMIRSLGRREYDIGVPLKAEHPQSLILCPLAKKKKNLASESKGQFDS